jgi:hypothetical protein
MNVRAGKTSPEISLKASARQAARKAAGARKGASPAPTAPKAINETSNATKSHSEKWTISEATRHKEIAVAKLKELEVKRQDGRYMLTADARQEMGGISSRLLALFDASLLEFANAVAAQPKISSKDVLRVLRSAWRDIRIRQAKMISAEAEALPPLVEDEEDA